MRRRRTKLGGKGLGTAREYSVLRNLADDGWFVIRCARSAGGERGELTKPIDLMAFRAGVATSPWFIQVSKLREWISQDEIVELRRLAKKGGATPMLCYKWGPQGHFAFEPVMEYTETGKEATHSPATIGGVIV